MADAEIFIDFKDNSAEFARRMMTNIIIPTKMAEKFQDTLDQVNKVTQGVNQSLSISTDKLGNVSTKMGVGISKSRNLSGQFLSIMFAGQALTQTFGGIANSALTAFGIFDMFSIIPTLIFAPISGDIAKMAADFTNFIAKLSPETKTFIANFIMILAIIGMVGAAIISLVLVAASIGFLLGGVGIAAQLAIGGPIIAIILLIALIIALVWTYLPQIVEFFKSSWAVMLSIAMFVLGAITGGIWFLVAGAILAIGWIATNWENIWNGIVEFTKGIVNIILGVVKGIIDFFSGVASFFGLGTTTKVNGSYQFGGIVPKNGMYMLHAGEAVSSAQPTGYQAGGSSNNINVTINASVANDYDVYKLARQLEEIWGGNFGR